MDWPMAPAYAYLAVLSVVLSIIDIRRNILPNVLTLTGYPIMLALLVLPAYVEDQWSSWLRAAAGSLLILAVFTGLTLLSSGSFGMGDAKLAGVLALPLAFDSWANTIVAMAAAFVLSALVSLVLLGLGRVNRTSLIPFGPFLIASTWMVTVLG